MADVKAILKNAAVGDTAKARIKVKYLNNLFHPIEGDKLTAYNKDRLYPKTKPFYEIVGEVVKLMKAGDTPTAAEQAVAANIFEGDNGEGGKVKKLRCEKAVAPQVYVKTSDGKLKKFTLPEGKGLKGDVELTVVFKVYENKYGKQLGFEGVIFDEEPELWTPGPRSFGGYEVEGDDSTAATTPAPATESAPAEAPADDAAGFDPTIWD